MWRRQKADAGSRGPAAFALCLLPFAACGTNLLVVRHEAELATTDGRLVRVHVWQQRPLGLLTLEKSEGLGFDAYAYFVGVLMEPVDIVHSTFNAAWSVFDPRLSVQGGPFGWAAAMTPWATLVPMMHLPPRSPVEVDAAMLARLSSADPATRAAAARDAFHDRWIVGLSFCAP